MFRPLSSLRRRGEVAAKRRERSDEIINYLTVKMFFPLPRKSVLHSETENYYPAYFHFFNNKLYRKYQTRIIRTLV